MSQFCLIHPHLWSVQVFCHKVVLILLWLAYVITSPSFPAASADDEVQGAGLFQLPMNQKALDALEGWYFQNSGSGTKWLILDMAGNNQGSLTVFGKTFCIASRFPCQKEIQKSMLQWMLCSCCAPQTRGALVSSMNQEQRAKLPDVKPGNWATLFSE